VDAMDRELALQTLSWCDQIEQALADNNQELIALMRGKLVFHFAHAGEVDIRVAVECARARAEQVLKEP
jgi:hypothetical protein